MVLRGQRKFFPRVFQFKSVEVKKKAFKSSLVDDEDNIGAWRSVRRTDISTMEQWVWKKEALCFEWKQKGHFRGSSAGYAINFHRFKYQRAKEVGQSVLHRTDCFWSQVWWLFATVVWGTDDYRVVDSFCHSYCLTAQHWNKHRCIACIPTPISLWSWLHYYQ